MKKILFAIIPALLLLCSCEDRLNILFDTPFVAITDESGTISEMSVDKEANNLTVELQVRVCASNTYFKDDIEVSYDLICGDGITEGVDFKVQPTTKSPLTFKPGEYTKPIRIVWYKTDSFDPSKDNTLTVRLAGCSVKEAIMGYPGPSKNKSEFIFTKQ